MREIKFRGKDKRNGEWRIGHLIQSEATSWIGSTLKIRGWFEVDPETVGQYTGLKDKNGVEIYEGDVYQNKNGVIWVIYYDDNTASFVADALNRGYKKIHFLDKPDGIVIGNIHDNPELLGKKD